MKDLFVNQTTKELMIELKYILIILNAVYNA